MTSASIKSNISHLIVLVCVSALTFAFVPAFSQAGQSKKPEAQVRGRDAKPYVLLKPEKPLTQDGGNNTAHATKVTPVAAFLRGGVSLTAAAKANLETLKPDNFWFKIPDWLAGKWEYYEAETTSYTDLKTGKTNPHPERSETEATDVWGWQRDKNGDIWQYEDSPHAKTSQADQMTTYYVRHKNEPVSSAQTKLVCKMLYTYSAVNASTQVISKTYQSEDFVSYEQGEPDRMRRDVSSKIFDQDANAIALSTSYSLAKRIRPFVPIDSRDGKNMRLLFRDYLKNHGRSDLIPDLIP